MSTPLPEVSVRVPDVPGPVLGWRCWYVVAEDGDYRLRSLVYAARWAPGADMVAECGERRRGLLGWRQPAHTSPAPDCTCGIYAALEPRLAAPYLERGFGPLEHDVVAQAIGEVALWGEVIQCERGWRASRAYPLRLHLAAGPGTGCVRAVRIAASLDDYGVPVEVSQHRSPRDLVASLG